jgi:hypothetical protein
MDGRLRNLDFGGTWAVNWVRRAPPRNGRTYAVGLDGTAGVAVDPPKELSGTRYSVMCWWRSSATVTGNIAAIMARPNDGPDTIMFQLDTNAGNARMIVRNDAANKTGNATGTSTLVKDRWYHLCGVRLDDTVYIYVDGKQEASASPSGGFGTTTWPATSYCTVGGMRTLTGGEQWSSELTGWIDQIRFYNRALSALEIAYIFRSSEAIYLPASVNLFDTAAASVSAVFNPLSGRGGAAAQPIVYI